VISYYTQSHRAGQFFHPQTQARSCDNKRPKPRLTQDSLKMLLNDKRYTFLPNDTAAGQEDFPFLRTDFDPDGESPLCDVCRQVNFSYILEANWEWPNQPERIEICLGTYSEARSRQQRCELCKLIVSKPWGSSMTPPPPPPPRTTKTK